MIKKAFNWVSNIFVESGKIIRDLLTDPNGKISSKRLSAIIALCLIIYMVINSFNPNISFTDNHVYVFISLMGFITTLLGVQAFTKS